MKRSNSLQNCQHKIFDISLPIRCISKSLPNIGILAEDCVKKSGGVKRQNSRKVKILQKTWDRVKTIIHPSGRRNSRTKQYPSELSEYPRTSSPLLAKYLKSSQSCSAPSTPVKKLVFDFDPIVTAPVVRSQASHNYHHTQVQDPEEVDQVVKNFVELQKRLSDELHQAIKEDKRKDEGLSEDFKKRLQQWELWKVSTGKYHYTEEELQKLIPLEFSKKLQEWEDMKSRPREEGLHTTSEVFSSCSKADLKNDRKKKKKIDESQRQKELGWLEKQLEKIEGEKKRLEREMVKYCQREVRLQKMREALQNNPNPKQEVWIKTPTAECKVKGINEKFTKKLYKWEEKKGIGPESSTMAFLNPKYYFPSTPEQLTPEVETLTAKHEVDSYYEDEVVLNPQRQNKDYSSQSEESEADEEFEEATDSFATKDEPASGTSNTDSDCFNLKPGYRRRSSDAISTPLSARSPSPSCCTSDDEENFMLQTVNENEEEKLDEKPPIVKAKPIVLQEDETPEASSSAIVKTQRTIFTPVETDEGVEDVGVDKIQNTFPIGTTLTAPKLVKSIAKKLCHDEPSTTNSRSQLLSSKSISGLSWEKKCTEPPRVIGVTRKLSNASSVYNYDLPPIPAVQKHSIKEGTKPIILGKIPVWCSPLMARRRFLDAPENSGTTTPQYDFSLDTFLQTNAISIPPPRPSRIPVTASPGCSRRKYAMSGGSGEETFQPVRLVNLSRSSSFQGHRSPSSGAVAATAFTSHAIELHPVQLQEQSQPLLGKEEFSHLQSSSVTKSKSTGSILGNSGTKGLFGFASKFVHNKLEPKQKRQILPSWLKTPPGGN